MLVKTNIEAINAFSWFIATLIYCLNSVKDEYKEKNFSILYRGMHLSLKDVLSYERYQGEIICFPSFTSTSYMEREATDPEFFGARSLPVDYRIKNKTFSFSLKFFIKFHFH